MSTRPRRGVGGIGEVWEAEQLLTGRKVAADYVPQAGGKVVPQKLDLAPSEYFAYPLIFNGALLGVLLFEGVLPATLSALVTLKRL